VSESDSSPPSRRVVALLVLLPLWLFVSSGIGLFLWWRREASAEAVEPAKFATPVEAERLADDMRKLVRIVGERHVQSEAGAYGLTRAAAMIEGTLGASNAGYRVETLRGPATGSGSWPLIVATLPGDHRPAVWVVAGYDSRPGSPGVEANASGLASVMAVADALAGDSPGRPVCFAFVPHAYDREAPVLPALDLLRSRAEGVGVMLVVEATGAGGELQVSSRDARALALPALDSRATVVGAESICLEDDVDLSSVLFEIGLPAIRVATRRVVGAGEADDRLPDPEEHATATRKLAELVRALASAS